MEKTRWLLLVTLLFLGFHSITGAAGQVRRYSAAKGLEIELNQRDGTYRINVHGQRWLVNGPTALRVNNRWYDSTLSGTGRMYVYRSREERGHDPFLGAFKAVLWEWQSAMNNVAFETSFKIYDSQPVLVFGQRFINETVNSLPSQNEEVVGAFPSFNQREALTHAADLHYLTYSNNMVVPYVGKWSSASFPSGAVGGFPLVLHDRELRTLVISPLTHFMVASQTFSPYLSNMFACGLLGTVQTVPKHFTHETIIYLGQGVHETMYEWGDILLRRSGKKRTALDADDPLRNLGYWTDNGAYYYYTTEPGKNYAQTMVDVKQYIDKIGLPVKNWQFDSWWYYKEPVKQGLILWEPMPSIFPDGMGAVDKAIGSLPLTLHNRYFAAENDYCKNYTCIIEPKVDMALPIDPRLFEHMMNKAKGWGLRVYEQDWLITTYLTMEATRNNVTNGRHWLMAMGDAAKKLDLTIQLCMALPRHLMQSIEMQAVTQARASDDYQPGNSQWLIGYTSMFHHAIGIVPFKDNFWSSTVEQAGCLYKQCIEPNAELQTLVVSLSAGPILYALTDAYIHSERVMTTCRGDGLLLKPDRPAVPLNAAFVAQYEHDWNGAMIEAWHTSSTIGELRWDYIMAANMSSALLLKPSDLHPHGPHSRLMVFDYYNCSSLSVFDDSHPLKLLTGTTQNGVTPFSFHIVVPQLENGWVVLGELNKFIVGSKQRFKSIYTFADGLRLSLVGAAGEAVKISVARPSSSGAELVISHVPCTIGSQGQAELICQRTSCSCA